MYKFKITPIILNFIRRSATLNPLNNDEESAEMPSLIEEEHWPTSQSVLASTQYPRIEAENDYQAVRLWLAEYRDSPQTLKSYRREAERLLLWLVSQGKGLRDMNREALRQFEAFLEDPQPRAA
mgnify:FL=1